MKIAANPNHKIIVSGLTLNEVIPLKANATIFLNGITSFSVKPLTMILWLGLAAIFISFAAIIYSLIRHFQGETIVGWTSMFASIWFLGGVQLVCIGVIGQYVGKTFMEVKERPRYYIESYLKHEK